MSPIGIYGSPIHVLTNKKVEDKKGCLNAQIKSSAKDSLKATAAVAGTAGAAAGVTALINKVNPSALNWVRDIYRGVSDTYKDFLKQAAEQLHAEEAMKPVQKLISKFDKIPAAGKVAIAVGVVASALVGSIHCANQLGKLGGIESKYETK